MAWCDRSAKPEAKFTSLQKVKFMNKFYKQGTLTIILLCLTALVAHAANYSVAPMAMANAYVKPGDGSFKAKVSSYGEQDVTQITYTVYNFDSSRQETEETITLSEPMKKGETRDIDIKIEPRQKSTKNQILLNITRVNGMPNEASTSTAYIDLYIMAKVATKRIVVEEYTGMWCQYCPRGTVAMEYLQRVYPERFIGIVVHSRDAIDTGAYSDILATYQPGFPTLNPNRSGNNLVNWSTAASYFENTKTETATHDISLSATWQANHAGINMTATVTPYLDSDNSRYAIAYVLTESGMTKSSWAQYNGYSGDYDAGAPEEYDKFYRGGIYVYGLTYDHVAIASKGIKNGMDNSLPASMRSEEAQTHTTSFDNLLQYSIIQDYDKLSVVAMIIDRQTGQIVNAAESAIATPTGITSIISKPGAEPNVRYNINGQRVGSGYKGLVIENGKKYISK